MEIIQINEATWRIEDDGVRIFLLEGADRAMVIDSGMTLKNVKEIAEGITTKPVELMNTHSDMDHIAGNASFDSCYMNPEDVPAYRAQGFEGEVIPVKEGDVIDLGGRPLEIIEIPGHTPGSIAILDVNNRALISGDTVQAGDIWMFGPARNLAQYPKSLEHLMTYMDRFDVVYPSHAEFPVQPDLIGHLRCAANGILSGDVDGTLIDMFGQQIRMCKFPFAGFLCEK